MTVRAVVEAAADELTRAGIRATVDPVDAHPPVVLLTPTAATRTARGWLVDVDAVLVAGGPAADRMWPWGDTLDRLVRHVGADRVERVEDPTGAVAVTVSFQLTD